MASRPLLLAERRRLGQLLRELVPDDWARNTGCHRWTVRDLVAHLIARDDVLLYQRPSGYPRALARWAMAMARMRFDADRFNRRAVTGIRGEPAELRRRFEAQAEGTPRWLFERTAPGAQLAEYLIHRTDIALPLGRPVPIDEATLRAALGGVARVPGLSARRLLRRRRWIATDIDWAQGRGAEVQAPGLDLLLALAGRPGRACADAPDALRFDP